MKKQKTTQALKQNALLTIGTYFIIAFLVLIYGFLSTNFFIGNKLFFLVLGVLLFTLVEYLTHRFLSHSGEDYKDAANWQYKIHGAHHSYPKDEELLAIPFALVMLTSFALFLLLYFVLGYYTYFFWSGLFLGYATYLFIHYKIHSRRPPKNMFKYLWKHHAMHHYAHEDKAYGVSSPLWDIIFGTMPPKKPKN